MEVNRTEKITFRCTALEKAALAEPGSPMRHQHIGILPYTRTGRTTQGEVHGRRKGTVSGDSRLKGTLQRLNNYFGGRQYREVFEENQALINELKKILSR